MKDRLHRGFKVCEFIYFLQSNILNIFLHWLHLFPDFMINWKLETFQWVKSLAIGWTRINLFDRTYGLAVEPWESPWVQSD
jgi:hypothetical protein